MATQNLRPLLEALSATPGLKKASGEVTDPQALLDAGALARLDAQHGGAYVFFLFDALADPAVAAYLATGSLASDSGQQVLALYERLPRAGSVPGATAPILPGLAVETENPIVAFGRSLFPDAFLTLPGLLVVRRLTTPADCVNVALEGKSREDVTASVRKVIALVSRAVAEAPQQNDFAQALGVALAKAGLKYTRSEGRSLQEHLARLLRLLWTNRRDLAAVIPVVGKAFARKSGPEDG